MLKRYYPQTQRKAGIVRNEFDMPSGKEWTSPHDVSEEILEMSKTSVVFAENPARRKI